MSEPKVSIVVAVYNAEKYLRQCLDSIANQTLRETEIICVDDGSTDNSLDILKEYKNKDNRFRIIHQKNTGPETGAASARNVGMALARGRYLSILDADDYFDINMLQLAFEQAEKYDTDIVVYDGYRHDDLSGKNYEDLPILNHQYLPNQEIITFVDISKFIFQLTIGAAWNCFYKRSFVENHQLRFQPLQHADDLLFVNLAFTKAERIGIVNQRLLYYRRNNPQSQSAVKDTWPESAYSALYALKTALQAAKIFEYVEQSFVNRALEYLLWYLNTLNNGKSYAFLYNKIRDEYAKTLGIVGRSQNYFYDSNGYKQLQDILKLSVEEYLFAENQKLKKMGFQELTAYQFPFNCIPRNTRIVLYGAGNVGRAFYIQLVTSRYCQVVLWVDKKAKELGLPVEDLTKILGVSHDYVVIAVENATVAQSIKEELFVLGSPQDKIVWAAPLRGENR